MTARPAPDPKQTAAEKTRRRLEELTGIPAGDLTGETPGEIAEKAAGILDRQRRARRQRIPMTEREELYNWARWFIGDPEAETPRSVEVFCLSEILEAARRGGC